MIARSTGWLLPALIWRTSMNEAALLAARQGNARPSPMKEIEEASVKVDDGP